MSLLGSAATNQSRHIGLQELVAMAAATYTFLGPSKHYKMIQNKASDEAVLVCSCYRLLEQLELSGSVAQLLRETTSSHWRTLRSGTASLIFLAGVWSRVALECLHQGISIRHIVAGMSKGLEMCLEACKLSAVDVESVVCNAADVQKQQLRGKSGDYMNSQDGLSLAHCVGVRQLAQNCAKTIDSVPMLSVLKDQRSLKHNLKLKHSRHFNRNYITDDGRIHTSFEIASLAEAVSHGCATTMNLVIEASRIQCRYSGPDQSCKALDIDKLATCLLPGLSEEHSSVLHGYVVMLSAEQALLVKQLKEQTLKIGLIHGDLSEKHRHVGFNRPKNATYLSDCSDFRGISREEKWMDEALRILPNLKVDIVLVSGSVTEQLKDHCLHRHILIIEHVPVSILNAFASATGALPVSYISQLSERCVGSGVRVNPRREYRTEGTEWTVVNVVTDGTSLVTALIASSVHAKLQSMEDEFWSCAYRVHHALKDGKLLPGAGIVELICIRQLQNRGNLSQPEEKGDELDAARAAAPYEQVILRHMAEAWMDYVSTLMVNTGHVKCKTQAWTCIAQHIKQCENRVLWNHQMPETFKDYVEIIQRMGERKEEEEEMLERERVETRVYDNLTVKFEVWRRALDLVFLILQTDTEIVTGINGREEQYRDFVIL
ncbi:Bardet-Biedl syndrome 12 protein [Clarias gariepinus]|uniref:Bardet-Biedl syndrome 12 protein n=1 Tax=Clarias gariepinus TaxID=13013 RepID=UPI00234C5FB1|nr:Bardet-Biedl syndrome 12 protein [Clarias gariepinus]XP_053336500.1 Bardet-Biedl syndrome 12 protein [Clarias gariepinus]